MAQVLGQARHQPLGVDLHQAGARDLIGVEREEKAIEEDEEEAKAAEEERVVAEEREEREERGGKVVRKSTGQRHRRLALAGRTTAAGEKIADSHISKPHRKYVETSCVIVPALEALAVGSRTRATVQQADKEREEQRVRQ